MRQYDSVACCRCYTSHTNVRLDAWNGSGFLDPVDLKNMSGYPVFVFNQSLQELKNTLNSMHMPTIDKKSDD